MDRLTFKLEHGTLTVHLGNLAPFQPRAEYDFVQRAVSGKLSIYDPVTGLPLYTALITRDGSDEQLYAEGHSMTELIENLQES